MTASWAGAFWRLATLLVRRPYQVSSAPSMAKALASRTFLSVPGAGLFPTSVAYFEISGGLFCFKHDSAGLPGEEGRADWSRASFDFRL